MQKASLFHIPSYASVCEHIRAYANAYFRNANVCYNDNDNDNDIDIDIVNVNEYDNANENVNVNVNKNENVIVNDNGQLL